MIVPYFDSIEDRIVEQLHEAQHTVLVAVAWLTSKTLIGFLCAMRERGVDVQVIVNRDDEINSRAEEEYRKFAELGGKIFKAGSETWMDEGIMHHKFCVIDYKTVITGSFNWTQRADAGNKENIVIISDGKTANEYTEQFFKLRRIAEPYFGVAADEPHFIFASDKYLVNKQDKFTLFWNVPEEYFVTLDDRAVENEDEIELRIEESKTYFLHVHKGDKSYTQYVFIEYVKDPQIRFSISHEYVVLGSQAVEISWEVSGATSVFLHPFGYVEPMGKREFFPEQSAIYYIVASNQRYIRQSEKKQCVVVPLSKIDQVEVPFPKLTIDTKIDITSISKPYFDKPLPKVEMNLAQSYQEIKKQVYSAYKIDVPKFEISDKDKKSLVERAKKLLSELKPNK